MAMGVCGGGSYSSLEEQEAERGEVQQEEDRQDIAPKYMPVVT
jgi:hypothetical protein